MSFSIFGKPALHEAAAGQPKEKKQQVAKVETPKSEQEQMMVLVLQV